MFTLLFNVIDTIMDHGLSDLWTPAVIAATVITVCAAELALSKGKRKVWVKAKVSTPASLRSERKVAHIPYLEQTYVCGCKIYNATEQSRD